MDFLSREDAIKMSKLDDWLLLDLSQSSSNPKLYKLKYEVTPISCIHSICDDRDTCKQLNNIYYLCQEFLQNYLIIDLICLIVDFIHVRHHTCCKKIL